MKAKEWIKQAKAIDKLRASVDEVKPNIKKSTWKADVNIDTGLCIEKICTYGVQRVYIPEKEALDLAKWILEVYGE